MGSEENQNGHLYRALFEDIAKAIAARLNNCGFYQNWKKEAMQIIEKYPFFEDVIQKGKKTVCMTEEEHQAFVRYIALNRKMQNAERQECYYVGQIHAGIMNKDLKEHLSSDVVDSFVGWGTCEKMMWNHEEAPECFGGILQRLEADSETRLKDNPGYQKLTGEERKLLEEHCFIQSMIEGDVPQGELRLSGKEQQAMIDYIAICRNKTPYEKLEIFQIGLKMCLQYLYTLFF